MNAILTEYGLPVIALIVAIVTLILVTKRERRFRKMIESDKEFMEWRKKHRNNKELNKQISKLEREIFKCQKKIEFLSPRIKKGFLKPESVETVSMDRMHKIDTYHEKIKLIKQRIESLRGNINNEQE